MISQANTLFTKLLVTSFVTFILAFSVQAQVKVTLNKTIYQYDATPRLADVLVPAFGVAQWYWPSSQLFRLNSTDYEATRDSLIALLSKDNTASKNVLKAHQHLLGQINEWQLADRVQIEIDFERARYSLAHNPQFEAGEYLLTLSERPKSLFIFGAVATPKSIVYEDNQCIQETIKGIQRYVGADLDKVFIISPDGKIAPATIAYWNKRCVVAMPGSSIYVPLQENQWFQKAAMINQQMALLSVNRIFNK